MLNGAELLLSMILKVDSRPYYSVVPVSAFCMLRIVFVLFTEIRKRGLILNVLFKHSQHVSKQLDLLKSQNIFP